jgi:glycosyltransferase involved in cell wall biosynthesis
MRILYTAPFVPYPPHDGARLIAFHYLQGLAQRGHELTLVLPLRRPADAASAARLAELGDVQTVPVRARSTAAIAREALRHGESLRIRRHTLPEVLPHFARALATPLDLVFLDSLFTAYLLPLVRLERPRLPVALLELNSESQVFRRLAATKRSSLWKLLALWEQPRIIAAERGALRGADRVLALSAEDERTLRELGGDIETTVVGPGIPTYRGETIQPPADAQTVLFLGSYLYPPNRDAARWLAREIWPRVRSRHPQARLVLAGTDPMRRIARLADPSLGIETPGFVEDAVAVTRQATLTVVPLRIGGGVRLKILEALANERPLVTTPLGAEGLSLTPGEHALTAESAEDFADAVSGLLADPARARALAVAGRERVEALYSWDEVIGRLEAALSATAASAAAPAPPPAPPPSPHPASF